MTANVTFLPATKELRMVMALDKVSFKRLPCMQSCSYKLRLLDSLPRKPNECHVRPRTAALIPDVDCNFLLPSQELFEKSEMYKRKQTVVILLALHFLNIVKHLSEACFLGSLLQQQTSQDRVLSLVWLNTMYTHFVKKKHNSIDAHD